MSLILASMPHIIKIRKCVEEMNSSLPTMRHIKCGGMFVHKYETS